MTRLSAILPCATLAAALTLAASGPVSGQQYPTKPVEIIVAFAPGGGNDFIARFMAQRLTTALDQQFIVENKAGARGSIGLEAVVNSAPDGDKLTLLSPGYTVNPSLYNLKFDPVA